MNDVSVFGRNIICKKIKWSPSELILASCLNFEYNEQDSIITINTHKTSQKALAIFLNVSFINLMQSNELKNKRDALFNSIKLIYSEMQKEFMGELNSTVPYHDKLWNRPGQKFAYQPHAIFEMRNRQHNLLAFDMRLGKTLTSISLSLLDKSDTTLIICPGSTKFTAWYDDLIGWGFNPLNFTIYDSKVKYCRRAFNEKYIVINYEMLSKNMDKILNSNIQHIIIDEAHRVKTIQTQTFKNVQSIVHNFPNSRLTLLSGTPIANRVDDMYAYFKLINHPLGASLKRFRDMYGIMKNGRRGAVVKKAKNTKDLSDKLSNFMIRRTQSEVFDMPQKQQIRYKIDKDDFKVEYDGLINELKNKTNYAAIHGHIMAINKLTSTIKVKEAINITEEVLEYGKKIVIFCSFTEPIITLKNIFASKNIKSVLVDGSVDMNERRKLIKQFWEDDECNVFLGNMRAAGEGINLSCASDIIIMNYPFTPKELEQPIERCTNPSNPKINTIHYLVCEDSIDEILYEILIDKKEDINAIVDKGKGVQSYDNVTNSIYRRLFGSNINTQNKLNEQESEVQSI
jgi:SNF2 family DNA or RNA helicase